MSAPGCGTHAGLGTELRAVAVLLLDRLGPVLDRARAEGGRAEGSRVDGPPACSVCPVCAAVALLRGERPELAVRLAEHAAGLLEVLQTALHEGAGAPPPPAPAERPAGPVRRVQHIPVVREAARC